MHSKDSDSAMVLCEGAHGVGLPSERLRGEKSFLEEVASKLVLERQERKGLFECMPLVDHERDVKRG